MKKKRTEEGTLEFDSYEWWMLWKYGLRRGRSSEANKKIERANVIESLADPSQSKQRTGKYLRNGTKPRKAHMEPMKKILAAKKMVSLTAGSTPVGEEEEG